MEMLGKGPRSPTILPTGTPRGEELLQNENRKQRSRIVDLERKIAEQEALIVAADHRAYSSGTCSVHLSQAYAHVGQAISVACSSVTSCFVASKPESETLLNKKPATVNAKMGRNAQSFIPDWYNGVEKHAKRSAARSSGESRKARCPRCMPAPCQIAPSRRISSRTTSTF